MSKKEKWEELYEEYKASTMLTVEELEGRWESQDKEYRKRLSEISDSSSEEYKKLKSEWKKSKAEFEKEKKALEKYKGIAKNLAKIEKAKTTRDIYQDLLDELLDARKENEETIARREKLGKEAEKLEAELKELKEIENILRNALRNPSLEEKDIERINGKLSENLAKQNENQHAFSQNQLALQKELEVTIKPISEEEIENLQQNVDKFNKICELLAEGKSMGEVTAILSKQQAEADRKAKEQAEAKKLAEEKAAGAKKISARLAAQKVEPEKSVGTEAVETPEAPEAVVTEEDLETVPTGKVATESEIEAIIADIVGKQIGKVTSETEIVEPKATTPEKALEGPSETGKTFDEELEELLRGDDEAQKTEAEAPKTEISEDESSRGPVWEDVDTGKATVIEGIYMTPYGFEIVGYEDDGFNDMEETLLNHVLLSDALKNEETKERVNNDIHKCLGDITIEEIENSGGDIDILYSLAYLGKLEELNEYIAEILDKEDKGTLPFNVTYDMRNIYKSGMTMEEIRSYNAVAKKAKTSLEPPATVKKDNIFKRFFGNVKLRFSEWTQNLIEGTGSTGNQPAITEGEGAEIDVKQPKTTAREALFGTQEQTPVDHGKAVEVSTEEHREVDFFIDNDFGLDD